MKNGRIVHHAFFLVLIIFTGCSGSTSLLDFVKEGGLETKGLINLALASNGARVSVSQDNPEHPASTLINGITSSANWDQGEGWEISYEGRFARGGYLGYGVEDPYLAEERGLGESFDAGDPSWRGLRMQTNRGSVNSALGWVIVEFPEKKTVNRAVIYTIDSEQYPAERFGVSDLVLQYWSDAVSSWVGIERLGKIKGQADNAIHDNKSGVITLRFQPMEVSRMRFVVRWTNDSKRYNRGYYTYANGTARLIEVELYGYEQREIDEEEVFPIISVQDANVMAEVEIVIENYADGYNKRNVDMLMSSISPDYLKDGETYSDLQKRMESVFAEYEEVDLRLEDIEVKPADREATVTSIYTLRHGKQQSVVASGILIFQLSYATGYWKITRIDTQ